MKKNQNRITKLIDEHLALRRGMGRSYETNEFVLRVFENWARGKYPKARTITREMVIGYLRTRRHISPGTRRAEIIYIRQLCTDIARSGQEVYIPEGRMLPPIKQNKRARVIEKAEVQRLLEIVKMRCKNANSISPFTYYTMIGLLWVSGLRIGEVISLQVGDIDVENKLLHVRKGKFGKERIVPLSGSSLIALKTYLRQRARFGLSNGPKHALFASAHRRGISKSMASHGIKNYLEKAKIKGFRSKTPRAHDFRHSFATLTLKRIHEMGDDPNQHLPALATVLGHTCIKNTQVYLHPSMQMMEQASERFERFASRNGGAL